MGFGKRYFQGKIAHGFQIGLPDRQFKGMALARGALANPEVKFINLAVQERSQPCRRIIANSQTCPGVWNSGCPSDPAVEGALRHSQDALSWMDGAPQEAKQSGVQPGRAGAEWAVKKPAAFD